MGQPANMADHLELMSRLHFQKLAMLSARAAGAQEMGRVRARAIVPRDEEGLEKEALNPISFMKTVASGTARLGRGLRNMSRTLRKTVPARTPGGTMVQPKAVVGARPGATPRLQLRQNAMAGARKAVPVARPAPRAPAPAQTAVSQPWSPATPVSRKMVIPSSGRAAPAPSMVTDVNRLRAAGVAPNKAVEIARRSGGQKLTGTSRGIGASRVSTSLEGYSPQGLALYRPSVKISADQLNALVLRLLEKTGMEKTAGVRAARLQLLKIAHKSRNGATWDDLDAIEKQAIFGLLGAIRGGLSTARAAFQGARTAGGGVLRSTGKALKAGRAGASEFTTQYRAMRAPGSVLPVSRRQAARVVSRQQTRNIQHAAGGGQPGGFWAAPKPPAASPAAAKSVGPGPGRTAPAPEGPVSMGPPPTRSIPATQMSTPTTPPGGVPSLQDLARRQGVKPISTNTAPAAAPAAAEGFSSAGAGTKWQTLGNTTPPAPVVSAAGPRAMPPRLKPTVVGKSAPAPAPTGGATAAHTPAARAAAPDANTLVGPSRVLPQQPARAIPAQQAAPRLVPDQPTLVGMPQAAPAPSRVVPAAQAPKRGRVVRQKRSVRNADPELSRKQMRNVEQQARVNAGKPRVVRRQRVIEGGAPDLSKSRVSQALSRAQAQNAAPAVQAAPKAAPKPTPKLTQDQRLAELKKRLKADDVGGIREAARIEDMAKVDAAAATAAGVVPAPAAASTAAAPKRFPWVRAAGLTAASALPIGAFTIPMGLGTAMQQPNNPYQYGQGGYVPGRTPYQM